MRRPRRWLLAGIRWLMRARLMIAVVIGGSYALYMGYLAFSFRQQLVRDTHLWYKTRASNKPSVSVVNMMLNKVRGSRGSLLSNFQQHNISWLIDGSPQLHHKGPYRVLYNYMQALHHYEGNQSVTYATHATGRYIMYLKHLVERWEGPVSAAIYAPGSDFSTSLMYINYLRRCSMDIRNRVSFHLIIHIDYLPDANATNTWADEFSCTTNVDYHTDYRRKHNLSYPVNVARNVAREGSTTHFVLVSDVELMPSMHLASRFLQFSTRSDNRVTAYPLRVFTLPIFEVRANMPIPSNKTELLQLIRTQRAVYFHRYLCPHCQAYPGVKEWLRRATKHNNITVFRIARRESRLNRWEPIYIGTLNEPLYDERLSWEGQQDKMTQMLELCLAQYRFIVLDNAFLVHLPGIKKRKDPGDQWRLPFKKENDEIYKKVIKTMLNKYSNHRKCLRQQDTA